MYIHIYDKCLGITIESERHAACASATGMQAAGVPSLRPKPLVQGERGRERERRRRLSGERDISKYHSEERDILRTLRRVQD